MRALIVTLTMAASLSVAACQQSSTEASTPPPRKSLARQAQMYQGQEQLMKVVSATVERGAKSGELILKANAEAPAAGYTNIGFLPRVYAAQPPDGIYEVDVVGDRPAGAAAQAVTPLEVKGAWSKYSDDRVKGVRFIAKDNEVVAMTPPAS